MEISPDKKQPHLRLHIKGYIEIIFTIFGHKRLTKPKISPHKHCEIQYKSKAQEAQKEVTSPILEATVIKYIQAIVGAVLFYGRSVEKKS